MIVAAYTRNTRYETLAHECVASWAKCGLEVRTTPYNDLGSFAKNCLAFTLEAYRLWDLKGPLFVIGVDTLPGPHARPDAVKAEIDRLTAALCGGYDVACEERPNRQPNMRVHSGIVGWSTSTLGRMGLLAHCAQLREELAKVERWRNDQELLHPLLLRIEANGGKWLKLPEGYNCKQTDSRTALIVHGHASRGT